MRQKLNLIRLLFLYLHNRHLSIQSNTKHTDGTRACVNDTKIGKRGWGLIHCNTAFLKNNKHKIRI